MQVKEQIEITTDYMQADLHIVKVIPTEIFRDMLYVMCSIFTEEGTQYDGVCYWYDGENKNIPFTLTKTNLNKL